MQTCLDCGTEFPRGERRGESNLEYKGYYCEECEEKLENND